MAGYLHIKGQGLLPQLFYLAGVMMNILLVDDEQDSRHYVAKFLEKWGHKVVETSDGKEALNAFSEQDFHLVLSDIRMPNMDGLQLLRSLRSSSFSAYNTDIVLFTAFSDVESAVEALRSGAYDYILKPVNVKELLALIDSVAEHQSLKIENQRLTHEFNEVLEAETMDIKEELTRIKQAYYKIVGIGDIVISSPAMRSIYEQARILYEDRSMPVLIEGGTGTGKEMIARYIHYGDNDHNIGQPFVDINCAALSSTLFESELFGYESGAFSGGLSGGQKGKFEMAEGGTLFLDEISEIPPSLQAKLLRVIQEKEFYRVGGIKKKKTNVRIICATNVDIKEKVNQGEFRRDLYFRLNTAHLYLPALNQRPEDIIPLAAMFLKKFSQEKGKAFTSISREAGSMLMNHTWAGNIRELKNTIEWVVLMNDDQELRPAHLKMIWNNHVNNPSLFHNELLAQPDWHNFQLPPDSLPLEEFTDFILHHALEMHNGNKTRTARYLGLSLRSLSYRLNKDNNSKSV